MTGGAFPDPQVVANERSIGLAAEELAGDKAVLLIHTGIDFGIDLDLRGNERMAAHVPAHQTGPIGEAVGKSRTLREQQKMRGPAVARGEDEDRRSILDG